jgi:putative nucleotidyltransferase with HDIG domain
VAVLIVWIAHYVLNIGLVTAVIALALRAPFISVWRANFRDVLYHQIFTAPLGALLAVLIQQQPLGVVLMLAPVYMMHRSMELMSEFRRQTINALLAFANSIDARDPSTYQHSQRVGELAKKIAEQMELPPDEVELIYLSARLHDLGKVAVTDMIFHKPGKLTDQEYRVIQTHPFVGAQIVENFPLFGPGRDLIKYHHERYDGRGYPEGLAHEEIPLGARIIAVADAYDAMTSDRPYRSRLPKHEAIKRIVEERSKQFDPQVVDAFLQVTAQAQAPASEPVTERGQTVSPHVQREAPATACSS